MGYFLKGISAFQGLIGFPLNCSICCFLAEVPVLSVDIVDTQNEIHDHYHYGHSPGGRVVATVREAAATALLCLK